MNRSFPSKPARSVRREIHGWFILDKPKGPTSTQALAQVKRAFQAAKAGHAGTLDPLASGLLPLAFGEATKTVPFIQEGEKTYYFTIQWGVETSSDDTEGEILRQSDLRPEREAIERLLPVFKGICLQRPPLFSAIKVGGARAYDLAREGHLLDLPPREVFIRSFELCAHYGDYSEFKLVCGKGTYVRSLARDLGQTLGCFGHISALRRTQVGPFSETHAFPLDQLNETSSLAALQNFLLPLSLSLTHLPSISLERMEALRVRRGEKVLVRTREILEKTLTCAVYKDQPIAFGPIEEGLFVPHRVFKLPLSPTLD